MTLACATSGYCLHVKARGAPRDGEVLGVRSGVCPAIVPLNGAGNGGMDQRGADVWEGGVGDKETPQRHQSDSSNGSVRLVKSEEARALDKSRGREG